MGVFRVPTHGKWSQLRLSFVLKKPQSATLRLDKTQLRFGNVSVFGVFISRRLYFSVWEFADAFGGPLRPLITGFPLKMIKSGPWPASQPGFPSFWRPAVFGFRTSFSGVFISRRLFFGVFISRHLFWRLCVRHLFRRIYFPASFFGAFIFGVVYF